MATAFYAPDYRVEINGDEIPRALRSSITSVKYEDGLNSADRVEIGIANVDLTWLRDHIRGLGFQPFPTAIKLGPIRLPGIGGDGLFDMDNRLQLSLGYTDQGLEEVFKGEITGVECNFPTGGLPTMTLVAHDYLQRLTLGKYGRGFGPLPDAIIAMILGAENLLLPAIDPTIAAASTAIAVVNFIFNGTGRKQKAQSDFELLKEIAETYDADFWVEGDVLYLARFFPKDYSPAVTLTWGESLLDFAPKVSTIGAVVGVGAKFSLREIPFSFMVTAYWDFDRECLGLSVVPGAAAASLKSVIGPIQSLINRPIGSPADITNSALVLAHKLRETINNRLTGSGTAVGDPRIRANSVIRLEGLGPDFSGDYRVTSATHTIDHSGYRTHFKVHKEIIP